MRLAAKLTGWRLDVKSESSYNADMKSGYDSLLALPDISLSLVDALFENGFYSVEELSRASVSDLIQLRDIDEEMAAVLIQKATVAWEEMAAAAEADEVKPATTDDNGNDDSEPHTADSMDTTTSSMDADEEVEEMAAPNDTAIPAESTPLSSEPDNNTGAKEAPGDEPIPENNDTN